MECIPEVCSLEDHSTASVHDRSHGACATSALGQKPPWARQDPLPTKPCYVAHAPGGRRGSAVASPMTGLYMIIGLFEPERDLPAGTVAIEIGEQASKCLSTLVTFVTSAVDMLPEVLDLERMWPEGRA